MSWKLRFSFDFDFEKDLKHFMNEYNTNQPSSTDNFKMLIRGRPELEFLREKPKKEVYNFIKKYMKEDRKKNAERYKKIINDFKAEFKKIKQDLIKDIEKLFDGYEFPDFHYKANFTIFRVYERYLDTKEFDIPLNVSRQEIFYVFIHEVLHFVFYEYMDNNFKNRLDEKSLWDLSEIIDVILMKRKPLSRYFVRKPEPYPGHTKHFEILDRLYAESNQMKEFIEKAIGYFNSL